MRKVWPAWLQKYHILIWVLASFFTNLFFGQDARLKKKSV